MEHMACVKEVEIMIDSFQGLNHQNVGGGQFLRVGSLNSKNRQVEKVHQYQSFNEIKAVHISFGEVSSILGVISLTMMPYAYCSLVFLKSRQNWL